MSAELKSVRTHSVDSVYALHQFLQRGIAEYNDFRLHLMQTGSFLETNSGLLSCAVYPVERDIQLRIIGILMPLILRA